ncbi:hypothetical protein PSTT_11724, partial [Puccinia striiformis]
IALLFLSACTLASPTPAAVVPRAAVTAQVCAALDFKHLKTACVAAGFAVGIRPSALAVSPSVKANVDATAFVGATTSGTALAGQANLALSTVGTLAASAVATLATDVVIPLLTQIAGTLNTAGATVQGVQRTADAQVSASVYQGFVTFATALRRVLSTISSLPSLYARAEARASIHASLLQIQAAVNAFIRQLFVFISPDLDQANVRAALSLSLNGAIQATA